MKKVWIAIATLSFIACIVYLPLRPFEWVRCSFVEQFVIHDLTTEYQRGGVVAIDARCHGVVERWGYAFLCARYTSYGGKIATERLFIEDYGRMSDMNRQSAAPPVTYANIILGRHPNF